MVFKVKISVLVILILINHMQSKSSSNDYTLNLCHHSNDVDYENYTDAVTQNCGCEKLDTCIRKCCQNGFFYNHDEDANHVTYRSMCSKHKSYQMYPFSVPIHDGGHIFNSYEIENFLVGMLDCNNMFYVKMNGSDPYNFFYLERNGSLYYPHHDLILSNERYCVDEANGLTAYLCIQPEADNNIETIIHVSAKLISIPFLMATGVVYALLPERNLHRSALMFHVFCLLLGNAFLACGQYTVIEDDSLCISLGYSILLFMVASFTWMNVICIDIFLAFSYRGAYVQEKIKRIVFKIASLYAWGLPILNVLIVFLLNNYGDEEAEYHPGIGVESCFLKNGLPTAIFYFGPILVIIIINIVLFILTAVNLRKIKTVENSQNKKRPHKGNDIFKLYWKLLFIMGLNPVVNTHVIQLIAWSDGRKWNHDVADDKQSIMLQALLESNEIYMKQKPLSLPLIVSSTTCMNAVTSSECQELVYLPVILLIVSQLPSITFINLARYLWLKLYWKLLFVMGLNPVVNTHVIQLISWAAGKRWSHDVAVYVWYFKDFAHASYGILIFVIFVCQKKIWLSLKERICCTSKKNNAKRSVSNSSVTSNSENDPPGIHLKGIQNTAGQLP